MNKTIITCIILLFGGMCIAQVQTQVRVGVNTENPQTLFHIDGASTPATTNPSTGTISSAQAIDDVVVTNSGDLGLGTITPITKLDINAQSPGGGLKIVDTTEGEGKVLISDANGVASWGEVTVTPGQNPWYAILDGDFNTVGYQWLRTLRQLTNFTSSLISDHTLGSVNQAEGVITVPYTGRYRIFVFGKWTTDRVGNSAYQVSPHIFKNGESVWFGSTMGYTNYWGITPTFVVFLDFAAGDKISLATDERQQITANNCQSVSMIIQFVK